MEEKICSNHSKEVISICLFEGCDQHFLCKECIKRHPDNHDSQVKGIISLMRNDDWIKSIEEQRDCQITKLKSCEEEKECLFEENQKKYNGMFEGLIRSLHNRLSEGTNELGSLSSFQDNSKAQETFVKVEESLKYLHDINFREGDIYDKADKAKLFNEMTLPASKELWKQLRDVIDEARIDETKIDSCKQEMLEIIQSIHLKDLLTLSNSKRQKASEKLNALQQENEILTQENLRLNQDIESLKTANSDLKAQLKLGKEQYDEVIETHNNYKQQTSEQLNFLQQENETLKQEKTRLNEDIEYLKAATNDFQAQLASRTEQYDHLIELNNNEKQKVENLTETNNELQNRNSMLNTELDSVVASKLAVNSELEALKVAYNKLVKKYPDAEFLSEDSIVVAEKDFNNIRTWIPIPPNSDGSSRCRLSLLYRATRDGFTSTAFVSKCKDKNPTITFIKSKEHGRVFGGYATKNWECKDAYTEDKEAFLFSLTHGEKYPIKTPQYAICKRSNYILAFGCGHDIYIPEGCNAANNSYSNFIHSYQCSKFANYSSPGAKEYLAGSYQFTVEEIEVYQVVWSE